MRVVPLKPKRLLSIAALLSGVALAASVNASPILWITDNTGGLRTPGSFPAVPPNAPDPSMSIGTTEVGPGNIPLGTKGYASSYLYLQDSSGGNIPVTFTFTGDGDAAFNNQFSFTDYLGNTTTWGKNVTPIGTTATVLMPANHYLNFQYTSGNGQCAGNDSSGACPNNYNPLHANFFIGAMPGPGYNMGSDAIMGLSDAGATLNTCGGVSGDCDYQDMQIDVSVPEPGSVFLVALGLLGLGWTLGKRRGRAPTLPA